MRGLLARNPGEWATWRSEARLEITRSRTVFSRSLAIRVAKRMMYKQLEMTLVNALEDAALSVQITNRSQDVREGTRAFHEKRKPKFAGR